MQVTIWLGFSIDELLGRSQAPWRHLAAPEDVSRVPDAETLYVVPDHGSGRPVSLGDGSYMPARVDAVYRDPARPWDAVCVVEVDAGGVVRCTAATFYGRDGRALAGGDLRLPLSTIVDHVVEAAGTGTGPRLPAGTPHPTGRAAWGLDRRPGPAGKRPRHRVDDDLLAVVAWVAGQAAREGRSTREAVAETFDRSAETAAQYIRTARDAGMLPEVAGDRRPTVEDNQPTEAALRRLGRDQED